MDGYFTLLHVPSDNVGLMLSYIGYQTKTIFLKPSLDVNQLLIELEPQSQLIEEVIVTAGLGIFTGIASDTLRLLVKKP